MRATPQPSLRLSKQLPYTEPRTQGWGATSVCRLCAAHLSIPILELGSLSPSLVADSRTSKRCRLMGTVLSGHISSLMVLPVGRGGFRRKCSSAESVRKCHESELCSACALTPHRPGHSQAFSLTFSVHPSSETTGDSPAGLILDERLCCCAGCGYCNPPRGWLHCLCVHSRECGRLVSVLLGVAA